MKKIVIDISDKYIDFQGKPGTNHRYVKISLKEERGQWVARFPKQALEDLINLAKKEGMDISVEE